MGVNRKCVAIDFDGVLHRYSGGWQNGKIYDTVDFMGIRKVQEEGYAVAVMTTRDVNQVAECIEGWFDVVIDKECEYKFWNGGESGLEVLITNRKVAAIAYVDDRAVRHLFDDDWIKTMNTIRELETRMKYGPA